MLPLIAALTDSAPPPALVAAQPARREVVAKAVADTSFIGGIGVTAGDSVGGLAFGILATHRFHWLELGAECQGAALFSSVLGIGGVGGLHFGGDFSVRILGAAGVHSYRGVGRGLLSEDPGISGSLPYAGGRLVLGYSFGRRSSPHRAFVGLVGAYDDDLARHRRSVTYTDEDWLFGTGSSRTTSSHVLGQNSVSGLLLAGVDLDLVGY